ncbi:MAG TPA: 6-carboxytetrahydropterin synthase [Bryobacteraceae bacterium]|nr:6-carboxytetrahydropterin synthase [Bryobacteraceae bacterium]
MIRVTRRYRFSASHRLHAPQLSDTENRELYGKCNNPFGHGHNYEVEVTVRGPVDARSGRAADIGRLDQLVEQQVVAAFDHRNLNAEVAAFRDLVPTSENLGVEVCRRLKQSWQAAFPNEWPRLEKIRIAETGRNIFEVSQHEIE